MIKSALFDVLTKPFEKRIEPISSGYNLISFSLNNSKLGQKVVRYGFHGSEFNWIDIWEVQKPKQHLHYILFYYFVMFLKALLNIFCSSIFSCKKPPPPGWGTLVLQRLGRWYVSKYERDFQDPCF